MENKKCICLSRVSTAMQELESQTEKIISQAISDGYDKNDIIIIENKESAVKNDEAHLLGITTMKEYIESGGIGCVYCHELSRLSRRPKDLYIIRDYLIEHGVQLVVINPFFKLLDNEGKFNQMANIVFSLFGAFAEQEGALRAERCKRGKAKKKEMGKFVGGKCPMGYSRDKDNNFIINEEESKVVIRIFNDFVNGKSKLSIGSDLRAEGMLQNFSSDINSHTHIDNVLHNEDYTGKNGRPQIISRELFCAAQARFPVKTPRSKVERQALGQGIMTNPNTLNRNKKWYVNTRSGSYYCYIGVEDTSKRFINIRGLDALLWNVISKRYEEIRHSKSEIKLRKMKYNSLMKRIKTCEIEIANLEQRFNKIEERLIMGRIKDDMAERLENEVQNEINDNRILIEEYRIQVEKIYQELWHYNYEDIDNIDFKTKQDIAKRIISKIELSPIERMKYVVKIFYYDDTIEEYKIDSYNWNYWKIVNGTEISINIQHWRGKDISENDRKYNSERRIKYNKR